MSGQFKSLTEREMRECNGLFLVQTSSENLDRPCGEQLEDLKFVLSEIANIRRISLDVELQYRSDLATHTHTHTHTHARTHTFCRNIQECYRTLAMYHLPVSEEEGQWCGELDTQWKELAARARQRDRDIIPDKRRFTVVRITVGGLICGQNVFTHI